jgi:hypothetical protein
MSRRIVQIPSAFRVLQMGFNPFLVRAVAAQQPLLPTDSPASSTRICYADPYGGGRPSRFAWTGHAVVTRLGCA